MKSCGHCQQTLLTLDDFPEHVAKAFVAYVADLQKFLATPMTDEDRRTALTFFQAELHESERWLNFIVWLVASNRVTVQEIVDMLEELNGRMLAILAPNPSKFEKH